MDRLVWVDLEATGLNPVTDEIIELGIIITDEHLNELNSANFLINPWGKHLEQAIEVMDPFIINMHTQNGLWQQLRSGLSVYEGVTQGYLEDHVTGFLRTNGAMNLPMCGNNIPFDRAMLKSWYPKIESLFHYRNLDVSSIKNAYKVEKFHKQASDVEMPDWVSPDNVLQHRALNDIRTSIMEYGFYREHLFR